MTAVPSPSRATVALLVSLAVGVGAGPTVAMVGGGSEAGAPARSTVMVLFRHGANAGFCSGVAVTQDIVLTAAHCVPAGAEVRINLPGSGAKPTLLPIKAVARNPGYRPDAIRQREKSIDLALVRLAEPLPALFMPATLAGKAGTKPGARFVASGFGVAREGDAPSSGVLRSVPLVAREPLSDVLLWAEDPARAGAGACTGDSGGPVSVEGSADVTALMVWSAGEGAKQCGSLTQAAWLSPQRAWIERVKQAWQAPARP